MLNSFLCLWVVLLVAHSVRSAAISSLDHPTQPHKRFVKQQSAEAHAQQQEAAMANKEMSNLKRYVASGTAVDEVEPDVLPENLRTRSAQSSTFRISTHTIKMKRGHEASENLVERGVLDPLLYYTQHVNHALSRRAPHLRTAIEKRATAQQEAEDRMRRRWLSIHQKAGVDAPELRKRDGMLEGLLRDTNMFGVDRGTAKWLDRSQDFNQGGEGEGFSEVRLAAAINGDIAAPEGSLAFGSAGLFITANDVGYFAEMTLGTPGKPFHILMDSGSADLWVPSRQCNDDGDCGGHQTLNTAESETLQLTDPLETWDITYGTGEAAGVVISDTISLSSGSLRQPNLTFGITLQESEEFSDPSTVFDGLMGLARSQLSNIQTPTYIEALANSGTVPAAQVGYKLASVGDGRQDSEITFGGVDATRFSESLTEFPNQDETGFWRGAMSLVTVNGADIEAQAQTAILDTGTTLIIAPEADAIATHAAIPGAQSDGQGGFTLPCTTDAEVAFNFGGQTFPMRAQDLTFVPVDVDNLQGDCQSAISVGEVDAGGSWLLGAAFLKNAYFATDVESNMMGLASLSGE